MTESINTKISTRNWARITGFLGVIVLISGSYAHSVNSKIIQLDNSAITAENLVASENMYRLGLVSGLLMETVFIFYAFLLYQLFKPVNKHAALLMLILALIPAPIFYLNQLNHFAAFLLAKTATTELMMLWLLIMGVNTNKQEALTQKEIP
jgi:hypothetical protein